MSMKEPPTFSLRGGPLHTIGARLGLVHRDSSIPLGLALGVGSWAILVLIGAIEGELGRVFRIATLGAHLRLLVVIPLFFVAESWLAPRTAAFAPMLVRADIIPATSLPALEHAARRVSQWSRSWAPETICALLAVGLTLLGPWLTWTGTSSGTGRGSEGAPLLVAGWYWLVCLTIFRFLLFRWVLRIGLWVYFLWRVSRLELRLVATHPDGAAGLGYLEVIVSYFAPFAVALSIVWASSFAEDVRAGLATFETVYPLCVVVLALDAAIFLGPLLVLAPKLWACRIRGLSDYMELASHYTERFEDKWVAGTTEAREPLLGTPDLQSLADLGNSVGVVQSMRWIPVSPRTLSRLAGAALLPMIPLLLLKYPFADLTERLLSRLTGL
jgi:hypothetical protein